MRIKSVKEIKKLIDCCILPDYHYKTNFNCPEFLIDIESHFIIVAKPICTDNDFHYEFILNTEFLSSKEISYKELIMMKDIIEILEANKGFVLKKFKKYTVQEYQEECKQREEKSAEMMKALQDFIIKAIG